MMTCRRRGSSSAPGSSGRRSSRSGWRARRRTSWRPSGGRRRTRRGTWRGGGGAGVGEVVAGEGEVAVGEAPAGGDVAACEVPAESVQSIGEAGADAAVAAPIEPLDLNEAEVTWSAGAAVDVGGDAA